MMASSTMRQLMPVLAILAVICTAEAGSNESGGMASTARSFVPGFISNVFSPKTWSFARAHTCKSLGSKTSPTQASPLGAQIKLRGGGNSFSTLKAAVSASENVLVSLKHFPQYDKVKAEDVVPGIKQVLKDCEDQLEALEKRLTTSDFKISASDLLKELEAMSDRFSRSWGVVSHLKMVKDTDALRKAYEEVQPLVVTFNLKVSQSEPIYKAFKAISTSDDFKSLSDAQKRIIESELLDAELSGVALEGEKKKRFNEIQQEMATLSTDFGNNVLDSTKQFSVKLTKKEEVDGLPESALALAAQMAQGKGDKDATPEAGPWVFTLDMPSYLPLQQHAKDRALREKMYNAFLTRASESSKNEEGKSLDNTPVINRILELRQEKAELLGKRHHADVSTAKKMASLESAMELLSSLREKSYDFAKKEQEDLQKFAESKGFSGELKPWDMTFYAERQREALYSFSEEELRPYFALPKVLDGLFQVANRLFDVEIVPAEVKAPTWDPAVQFWQINRDGKPAAYFYLDPYARPGEKRGGAWMDECASRSRVLAADGSEIRLPIAHMVCNQSPPVGDKPSLMTFREVETMFHEFGHAIQHMLTTQDEGLVAGIRGVEWDAVELPSQFMENWCYDKPTIDKMAIHYETGETIPAELWEKIKAAKNFRAGSMMLRQLQFAVTDLTLHSSFNPEDAKAGKKSVHDAYKEVAKTYQIAQPMEYDRFLCAFSHIFAGGYSAGYYSYKWAEVLSADAFAAFEEAGLDNDAKVQETGRRFRDTVLSLGGGKDAGTVFKMFRGREPTPDALLRHSGLVAAN